MELAHAYRHYGDFLIAQGREKRHEAPDGDSWRWGADFSLTCAAADHELTIQHTLGEDSSGCFGTPQDALPSSLNDDGVPTVPA